MLPQLTQLLGRIIFHRHVVIVGTGTDVGKSVATGALLGALRRDGHSAVSLKWIQTGAVDGETDVDIHERVAARHCRAHALPDGERVGYSFRLAASPHLAAEAEGVPIDKSRCREMFTAWQQTHIVMSETSGGICVPITRSETLIEWVVDWNLPVILVTSNGLGTLNHTSLTLEALRQRHITILGLVITPVTPNPGVVELDNAQMLASMMSDQPVIELGWIPL